MDYDSIFAVGKPLPSGVNYAPFDWSMGVQDIATGAVSGPIKFAGSVAGLAGDVASAATGLNIDTSFDSPLDFGTAKGSGLFQISQGVSEFLTGFLPIAGQVGKIKALGTIGTGLVAGAITDFAGFSGQDERLSNLLIKFDNPVLNNAVTQYLAAKEGDGKLEGRLKNAIEGLGLGLATEGLFKGIKALKAMRSGKPEVAAKIAESVTSAAAAAAPDVTPKTVLKVAGQDVALVGDDVAKMVEMAKRAGIDLEKETWGLPVKRPKLAGEVSDLSKPAAVSSDAFRALSEQHARYDDHLTQLVKAGALDDASAELARAAFSGSDLKFYKGVKGVEAGDYTYAGMILRDGTIQLSNGLKDPVVTLIHEMSHAAFRSAPAEAQVYITNLFKNLESTGELDNYLTKYFTGIDNTAYAKGYFGKHPEEFFAELAAHSIVAKQAIKDQPVLVRLVAILKQKLVGMIDRIRGARNELSSRALARLDELTNYVTGFSNEMPEPMLKADQQFAKDPLGEIAKADAFHKERWDMLNKFEQSWGTAEAARPKPDTETFYRGDPSPIGPLDVTKATQHGLSLTTDRKVAESYGQHLTQVDIPKHETLSLDGPLPADLNDRLFKPATYENFVDESHTLQTRRYSEQSQLDALVHSKVIMNMLDKQIERFKVDGKFTENTGRDLIAAWAQARRGADLPVDPASEREFLRSLGYQSTRLKDQIFLLDDSIAGGVSSGVKRPKLEADASAITQINVPALLDTIEQIKAKGSSVDLREDLMTFINYGRSGHSEATNMVLKIIQNELGSKLSQELGLAAPTSLASIEAAGKGIAKDPKALGEAVAASEDIMKLPAQNFALRVAVSQAASDVSNKLLNAAANPEAAAGIKEQVVGTLSYIMSLLLPQQRIKYAAALTTTAGRLSTAPIDNAAAKAILPEIKAGVEDIAAQLEKEYRAGYYSGYDAGAGRVEQLTKDLRELEKSGNAASEMIDRLQTELSTAKGDLQSKMAELEGPDLTGKARLEEASKRLDELQGMVDDLQAKARTASSSAGGGESAAGAGSINPVNPGKTLPEDVQSIINGLPEQTRGVGQSIAENLWELARKGEPASTEKLGEIAGIALEVAKEAPDKLPKVAEHFMNTAKTGMSITKELWLNSILSGKTGLVNLLGNSVSTIAGPAELIAGGEVRRGFNLFVSQVATAMDMFKAAKSSERAGSIADAVKRSFQTEGPILDSVPFEGVRGGAIPGKLGRVIRLPWRILGSTDEFFKQLHYRSYLRMQALDDPKYLKLLERGDTKGAASFIEDFIQKGFDGAGHAATDEFKNAAEAEALHYARELTFQSELGTDILSGFGKAAQSMVKEAPILGFVVPFIKTPTNIMRKAWRLTPGLNLLMKEYRDRLFLSKNPIIRAQARGEMLTGLAATSMIVYGVATGQITGSGPFNRRERDILMATGWQPLSFVVTNKDGSKSYYSLARIEPFNTLLGLVADTFEAMQKAHASGDKSAFEQLSEIGQTMPLIVGKNIVNKTWFTGLTSLSEALQDPENKGANYFGQIAAGFVPSLTNMVNPDPYSREVRTMLERVRSRIPGLSEGLDPRRNIFGAPVPYTTYNRLSPFAYSEALSSPAKAEMAKLQYGFGPPAKTLGGIDLTLVKSKTGQSAYDRFQELHGEVKLGGKTLEQSLDHLIQQPQYQALPEPVGTMDQLNPRVKKIQEVIARYRQAAQRVLLREFPDIQRLSREVARQAKTGQPVASSADRDAIALLVKK